MKNLELLSGLALGIIIIVLGFSIPENKNFNYGLTVKILGIIIIVISFFLKKKNG